MLYQLGSLLGFFILICNACAILHEKRFLKPRIFFFSFSYFVDNLDEIDPTQSTKSFKNQFISFLQAVRWLRGIF